MPANTFDQPKQLLTARITKMLHLPLVLGLHFSCSQSQFGGGANYNGVSYESEAIATTEFKNCEKEYISDCYLTEEIIEVLVEAGVPGDYVTDGVAQDGSSDNENAGTENGNSNDEVTSGGENGRDPNNENAGIGERNGDNLNDGIAPKIGDDALMKDTIVAGDSMETASFCSRNGTEHAGTNILQADKATLKVYPLGRHYNSVLETKSELAKVLRDDIIDRRVINEKALTGVLQNLPDGPYTFQLCDAGSNENCQIDSTWLEEVLGDWEELEEAPRGTIGASALVVIENQQIIARTQFGALFPRAEDGLTHECDEVNSPLILDLDGSGIQLSAPLKGISFDIKGNGVKSQISWPLRKNAGFLALDRNGNGNIDNVDELFGNSTRGPDNKKAKNGFAALAKYDTNRDGLINRADKVFDSLRVWIDSNFNGVSEQGEMTPLTHWRIHWLKLDYKNRGRSDIYGNLFREESLFSMATGRGESDRILPIIDVWFRTLPLYSERQNPQQGRSR